MKSKHKKYLNLLQEITESVSDKFAISDDEIFRSNDIKGIPQSLGDYGFLWSLDKDIDMAEVDKIADLAKEAKVTGVKQASTPGGDSSHQHSYTMSMKSEFSMLQGEAGGGLLMQNIFQGSEIPSNMDTGNEMPAQMIENYRSYYIPWIERIVSPDDRLLDCYSKNYDRDAKDYGDMGFGDMSFMGGFRDLL